MDKIRIVINMLGSENARVIQKNAQDYVSRNFSMEKMTDRYLELYKSLIKPGKLY
jgi:glycosyltransferase involved in cell wall biosynthesis